MMDPKMFAWDNKILEPLALWALIFVAKYGAAGIHHKLLRRPATLGDSEISRVGVEFQLLALGIFWGWGWERVPFGRTYLGSFIVAIFLGYILFLFLEGKTFSEIVSLKKPYIIAFFFSLVLGWLTLNGAVNLRGGN